MAVDQNTKSCATPKIVKPATEVRKKSGNSWHGFFAVLVASLGVVWLGLWRSLHTTAGSRAPSAGLILRRWQTTPNRSGPQRSASLTSQSAIPPLTIARLNRAIDKRRTGNLPIGLST